MKALFIRIALLALSLLASTAARAQISEAAAEQLMRLSGQWAQLESVSVQMRDALLQGMTAGPTPARPEVVQRVKAAADAAFSAERSRQVARQTLSQNVREAYVAELLKWYESPVARRISQAEVEDTARPQTDLKARTQAGMAVVQAASPARQQLLVRLVEVTRAPRAGADIVINMGVMLPLTLMRFDDSVSKVTETELRQTLEAQRPQLTKAFETISLTHFALMYQALPDDALEAYASFMAGSAGEHYTDIGERAFEAAILAAIEAMKP